MFILSFVLHLGFFFLLLNTPSVSSPRPNVVEITIAAPEKKKSSKELTNIIPKGDIDASGRKCNKTYGGIGIILDPLNFIKKVYEGYSASQSGLQTGDQVVSLNEIRGEPGTTAHITIIRNNKYIDFSIIREKICYDI